MPLMSPASRRLALLPSVLLLSLAALLLPSKSAHAQTTTFTGKVYSPAGAATGDPIPNILVFIQDPTASGVLPVFTQGVTIPATGADGCSSQQVLTPATVLGEGLTGADGSYTFSTVGALPNPMNVVIQAGKWRLQTSMDSSKYTLGGQNTLPSLAMPSKQIAGVADLPHIAVVTGAADQIECIFRQIGISDSEITDPLGGGSINLFQATTNGGETVSTTSPTEAQLLNPALAGAVPPTNYDLVMFGCQGSGTDNTVTTYAKNLLPYVNEGGRIFSTHFGSNVLTSVPTFKAVATWATSTPSSSTSLPATIDQTYAGGKLLASWMQSIGALDISTTPTAQFTLSQPRQDTTAVLNPPAQSWGYLTSAPTHSIQFTFDTPIGATGIPTVTLSYVNNTTTFLQGDTADSITLTVNNTSTAATTPGLQLALSIPSNITATTLVDSSGGNWVCTLTPSAVCTLPGTLAAGASDSVTLTFSIATNATVGQASLTAALTGGGLSNSGRCGRVLYNDYHVEEPTNGSSVTAGTKYGTGTNCPALTGGKLSGVQKFLEYSLYNLSNFVSPTTTDLLLIQGAAKLSWAPTTSSLYYGNPYAPNNPAIDDAFSAIAGGFTYTADSTINPLDVGAHILTATFVPTDPNYVGGTITTKINVLSDPTSSAITGTAPTLFYGQTFDYTGGLANALSIQVIAPGYIAQPVNAGAFNVTVDGTTMCTGTGVTGTCITIATLDAGTHNVQLNYSGTPNTDFLPSSSPLYPVVIAADPTTTAMTASATTSINLQPIVFTAVVSDAYITPVGPVTFYDSTTTSSSAGTTPVGAPLGIAALDPTGTATLTTTTVFTGTHNISACFTPALNSLHTYNYLVSCSASTKVVVTTTTPANPTATFALVSSSANPSAVGQAVSFTASVATSGNFTVTPTGTVNFMDGATLLNTATLDSNGFAVFTTAALAVGTHPITVVYAGNTTFAASTSGTLNQVVNTSVPQAGTGFLLLMDSSGIRVPIGGSTSIPLRIVELSNFNQAINFTCDGLPAETTCTFATNTIPSSGGVTQLTISAAAPHDCNSNSPYFVSSAGQTGLLALAALTFCLARRRRKLQGIALAAILCLLPVLLTGCGNGNCTDFGVKPGTYTFTITATSTGTPVVVQKQVMTMNAHL